MNTRTPARLLTAIALVSLTLTTVRALAQDTVFTYQGRLLEGGTPVNGTNYDMVFQLFDAPTNGTSLGTLGITNVTVSNGLFAVPLNFGDVFDGQPRWLEISVQTNGGALTILTPRQPITPTPYAIRALQAGGVAEGSITTASIAPGGLAGSVIQSGTITSNLLAPGAVNPAALQSPYQSGRIDLGTFIPPAHFGATVINQPVSFAQPFAVAPTVTVSLETSSRAAAAGVPPLLVSSKTTAGFTATFNVKATPRPIAHNGSTYFYSGFPLRIVNGRPAAVFNAFSMGYARALDDVGQSWGPVITLSPEAVHMDLAVINGNPAIAFISSTKLQYVRANDADGATWPAPAVLQNSTNGVYTPQVVSLTTISGRPAMVLWNSASNTLYYLRANDSNGTSWPANGVLIAPRAFADFQLAEVSGRPAVVYEWDNGLANNNVGYQTEVRYLRALDSTGTSWPASPTTLVNYGPLQSVYKAQLLMVQTNPAVAFGHTAGYNDYEVTFLKATDTNGSTWGTPTLVSFDSSYPAGALSFALVNGNPALAWYGSTWYYAESSNGGTSFYRYVVGDIGGFRSSLADVQGKPALTTYYDGDVVYLRDTNPIAGSFINWIAVQP
jgi:hypothetical protein